MVMETPTHFSLASRALKLDTKEHIAPHLQPLTDPSARPTTLSLSGNTLGVEACQHLATTLRTQTQLEVANLADIFTGRLLSEIPPALSALLTALLELPKLHTVDLSDNAFGLNTVEPLVDFLAKHVPLQHLILQNNGLGPAAGAKVADALTALAERKEEARKNQKGDGVAGEEVKGGEEKVAEKSLVPDLETVVCGRNRLESGSMASWGKTFTAHARGMKTVKMVQNGIRQDGIVTLLRDGLAKCGSLEVLDLQDNTFTITGARALVGVVGKWSLLKELGIGDSLLGARGAVLLATELGKKGTGEKLECLRAQYNEIDSRGVKALYETVQKGGLEKLRRVELNGNKFSEDDEGIEELRMILEKRKSDAGGVGGEDDWGLDELDELESEDEDEDEEDQDEVEEREEEDETEGKRETILKDADAAVAQTVAQKKDDDVDDLADKLGGTHV